MYADAIGQVYMVEGYQECMDGRGVTLSSYSGGVPMLLHTGVATRLMCLHMRLPFKISCRKRPRLIYHLIALCILASCGHGRIWRQKMRCDPMERLLLANTMH